MIAVIGDIHGCHLTMLELYEQIIKKYADMVEASIRKHPETWLWSHNRWKRAKPEDES